MAALGNRLTLGRNDLLVWCLGGIEDASCLLSSHLKIKVNCSRLLLATYLRSPNSSLAKSKIRDDAMNKELNSYFISDVS